MSKQRAKNRAARQREGGIKAAARGAEHERRERRAKAASAKRAPRKHTPVKRTHRPKGRSVVGRPDGPLARRRRFRTRLLLVALVLVNVVVGAIWRDWSVSLAVLILSAITAPLLAALLLRRR